MGNKEMTLRTGRMLALLCAAPLFFASLGAHAQQHPCAGPGPGEVVVGIVPASNGIAQTPICAPANGGYADAAAPPAPLPDVFMSVVSHPDTDKYWFAHGFGSNPAAENAALDACRQAMGSDGCGVMDSWSNNANIVVVEDAAGNIFAKGGQNFFKAWFAAREECQKYSSGCHKVETLSNAWGGGVVEGPRAPLPRRPWGAIARPKTKAPEPLDDTAWIATGQGGIKAAEDAAMAACQEASHLECQVRVSAGGGYMARMVNDKGSVFWFNAPTLDALDKGIQNNCPKGDACRVVDTFDVRPPSVGTLEVSVSKAPLRGFVSMARPIDDQAEKAWDKRAFVSGQPSVAAAQAAAIALCEKRSGAKCEATPKDGDNGVDQFLVLFRTSTGEPRSFWGTSASQALKWRDKWCEEQNLQCPQGTMVDLAKKNVSTELKL
jgi:hypothetical protein